MKDYDWMIVVFILLAVAAVLMSIELAINIMLFPRG